MHSIFMSKSFESIHLWRLFSFHSIVCVVILFGAEKFGRKKIIKFFFFFLQKLIILFFFDQTFCGEESFVDQNPFAVRLRKYYISEGIFRMHNAFWPTQFFTSQQGKERTFTAHPSAQVVILLEAALKLHLLCR